MRDTFQLASALSGLRVVDEAYSQTQVRERITWINPNDKFYYPAGYFEQNGASAMATEPGALAQPHDDVRLVAEVRPEKPTPTPTPVAMPAPSPSASPAQEIARTDEKTAAPDASPEAAPAASPSPAEPQSAEDAEKALQAAKQDKFPPINTRPFTDLLKKGQGMKEAGEIDLSGTLEMTVEGDRRDDGTLTNVEITGGSASDAKLKELAKAFISALSDSKALASLKDTRHLRMHLLLDDKQMVVRIVTEVATEEQARQMAQGYKGLILIGALSKRGRDEEAIFKSLERHGDRRADHAWLQHAAQGRRRPARQAGKKN